MSHFIQAIIASTTTADAISRAWPELPRLDRDNGYTVFPVNADLIDARIAPDATPTVSGDEFMFLTNEFLCCLRELSRFGPLAYVETEYFGGVGGQGALVCRDGEDLMPPTWDSSGTINAALRLLGIRRGLIADRFASIGLNDVRSNEDLVALIARQATE